MIELGNRPSPEQLLVLRAALEDRDSAGAAWREWRARVDFDAVDHGSLRLLPLVYRNLGPDFFDDEVAGRLKGLYRRSWSRNQLLFKRAGEAIAQLTDSGIETMVLKGAPVARFSYRDDGTRPMEDVDVLVPLRRAGDAIGALTEAGWRAERDDPLAWTNVHHSLGFDGPDGGSIDLHWFSLWQPARDEELWSASVPMEIGGVASRAPCAADQLLLVCVHGTPWSPLPPFRWIADAISVIRAEGADLDWDRVTAEAERRRLTVATGAALEYLACEFAADVPQATLATLASASAPRHERVAFRAACRSDNPVRTLQMAWDRYRRLRDLDTGAADPGGFVSFARRFWGLDTAWELPAYSARAFSRWRRRERGALQSGL